MARNPAQVGIETRHEKRCATRDGAARCNCQPSSRGVVYDKVAGRKRNGPWLRNQAEARGWRTDALHRLRHGGIGDDQGFTVRTAGAAWFEAARAGVVRASGGARYKPSTLRGYESSFNLHIVTALGGVRLSSLTRRQIQGHVDRLSLTLDGSTVCNAVMPLRVICRHAVTRQVIEVNPCDGLELPSRRGKRFAVSDDGLSREQVATPEEAAALISALPDPIDRAIWATAFYAGLRRGELRGLYRNDIDLDGREIRVTRGWDTSGGAIETKSASGDRTVPITEPLHAVLDDHLGLHDGREFAFPGYGRWGREYGAFSADALLKRSHKTWKAAGLQPILLHEARHTYASLMIDAGIPIAKVSRRMGHSSITVTERTYVHCIPNSHDQERTLLDAYLLQDEVNNR